MSEGSPTKRMRTSDKEVDTLSKDELISKLKDAESHISDLEAKVQSSEDEEKLKQQQVEATRRENVLVMRLTGKEQEMQEYINQIQELKQAQTPSTSQLRTMLLDPAINLAFLRMKKEMDTCKDKLEQGQNELSAWKFTPDSQTGKRLMSRCRMLLSENEELGKMISAGRTAKLEGEIALEKKLVEELKQSQAETDEFLVELDEDVEGMQSTIYFLQQQLKESKDEIENLRNQLQQTQHLQATTGTVNQYVGNDHHLQYQTTDEEQQMYHQHHHPAVAAGSSMEPASYSGHYQDPRQVPTDHMTGQAMVGVDHVTDHMAAQTNGHHMADDEEEDIPTPTNSDNEQMPEDYGQAQQVMQQLQSGEYMTAHMVAQQYQDVTDVSSSDTWSPVIAPKQMIEQVPEITITEYQIPDDESDRYTSSTTNTSSKLVTTKSDECQENGLLEDAGQYTDEEM